MTTRSSDDASARPDPPRAPLIPHRLGTAWAGSG